MQNSINELIKYKELLLQRKNEKKYIELSNSGLSVPLTQNEIEFKSTIDTELLESTLLSKFERIISFYQDHDEYKEIKLPISLGLFIEEDSLKKEIEEGKEIITPMLDDYISVFIENPVIVNNDNYEFTMCTQSNDGEDEVFDEEMEFPVLSHFNNDQVYYIKKNVLIEILNNNGYSYNISDDDLLKLRTYSSNTTSYISIDFKPNKKNAI